MESCQHSWKGHGDGCRAQPLSVLPGNTEQVIAFYHQVFGGQVTITRRGDVDPAATAGEKNQVVNALLTGGWPDSGCGPVFAVPAAAVHHSRRVARHAPAPHADAARELPK
jgi:hypothetical protein